MGEGAKLLDSMLEAAKNRPADGMDEAMLDMAIKKSALLKAAKEYAEAQAKVDLIDQARRDKKEKETADANV